MSSVRVVPETKLMSGEQLSADDAWHTVRRYGLGHLLAAGFLRFRYGDGLSHARAVMALYAWTAMVALGAAAFAVLPTVWAAVIMLSFGALAVGFTVPTSAGGRSARL